MKGVFIPSLKDFVMVTIRSGPGLAAPTKATVKERKKIV
jgi:hypothetical protein